MWDLSPLFSFLFEGPFVSYHNQTRRKNDWSWLIACAFPVLEIRRISNAESDPIDHDKRINWSTKQFDSKHLSSFFTVRRTNSREINFCNQIASIFRTVAVNHLFISCGKLQISIPYASSSSASRNRFHLGLIPVLSANPCNSVIQFRWSRVERKN